MMYRPVVFLLLIFLASTCNGFSSTRRTTTAGRGTTHLILPSTETANHYFLPSKEILTHTSTAASLSPTQIGKSDSKDIISLCGKKSNSSEKDSDGNTEKKKMSPATLVLAPLVFLFGLDLVLNIAVVTKRSLEVFFTGEYTVYTPWQ